MNPYKCLLVLVLVGVPLAAAEFTIHVVDGLGRPIPSVQIEVFCRSAGDKLPPLQLMADQEGVVHGTYDAATCTPSSISIHKEGYQPYFTGFRDRYVMQRALSAQDIPRIVKLPAGEIRTELRELLAGRPDNETRFVDSLFYHEAELRPALHDLARIPEVTLRVRQILSTIAASDDLHLIMQLEPPPPAAVLSDRWRYQVATALVNPDSEEEWAFLRRGAFDEFKDRWVDSGAIQTLKLTASARSRSILEEARQKNPARAAQIDRAIAYIQSNPPPLVNADLELLGKTVAQPIKIGNWKGNGAPRFNQAGDKALIDFKFETGEDLYGYTATFHRIDGRWTLRGVHESYQAMIAVVH